MALDDETFFVNTKAAENYSEKFDEYNTCAQACQEPQRKFRFETEFQMREFQLNLNECFYFCQAKETGG